MLIAHAHSYKLEANLHTQKLQKCQFSGSQAKSDPLFFHGGNSTHAVCSISSLLTALDISCGCNTGSGRPQNPKRLPVKLLLAR